MSETVISTYYSLSNYTEKVDVVQTSEGYMLAFYKKDKLKRVLGGKYTFEELESKARKWAYGKEAENWERGIVGEKFER